MFSHPDQASVALQVDCLRDDGGADRARAECSATSAAEDFMAEEVSGLFGYCT